MFRQKPVELPKQNRTPEWLNAGTGVAIVVIAIITHIASLQVNLAKLRSDSEMIKKDTNEIKTQIYPRSEAESALKALQDKFQSSDRLLEEKIKHLEKP